MSEEMSKNTSSDFLDNSYKDIDSAVSLDESQDPGARDAGSPTEKKGGVSQKMMIIGGVSVGALLLGGYWFLTNGQQPAPVQQPEPAPQQAPTQPEQPPISFNEPAPTPAPVEAPVAPVAPTQEIPVAPSLLPETPVANNDLSIQAPSTVVMPEAVPQLSEPVPEVNQSTGEVAAILESAKTNPNEGSMLPVNPVGQVAPVPAPVEPIQAIAANAPQTAHVDELRSLFDKHSVEIDKLDIRLTALEAKFDKSVQEQMAINKRVDERLAKLESGAGVKSVASNNSNNSASSAKSDTPRPVSNQRKRVKKASTSKQTTVTQTSKVTVQNEPSLDSTTLVDKRGVVAAAKPKQESIEIHSVFSGRLWIKNADSTLSTFAVGEAIPGGEKVKRIDEVSKKIYTDKRVISY